VQADLASLSTVNTLNSSSWPQQYNKDADAAAAAAAIVRSDLGLPPEANVMPSNDGAGERRAVAASLAQSGQGPLARGLVSRASLSRRRPSDPAGSASSAAAHAI
jgi:hypothetical protein